MNAMKLAELIVASKSDLKSLIKHSIEQALEDRIELKQKISKDWLTNKEAQEYLGLSRATLQRYRSPDSSPYLPSSKVGSKIYYRREDIEALLEEHMQSSD